MQLVFFFWGGGGRSILLPSFSLDRWFNYTKENQTQLVWWRHSLSCCQMHSQKYHPKNNFISNSRYKIIKVWFLYPAIDTEISGDFAMPSDLSLHNISLKFAVRGNCIYRTMCTVKTVFFRWQKNNITEQIYSQSIVLLYMTTVPSDNNKPWKSYKWKKKILIYIDMRFAMWTRTVNVSLIWLYPRISITVMLRSSYNIVMAIWLPPRCSLLRRLSTRVHQLV